MRCFTACFRTNSNHKKIITSSNNNKINSISPQALQDLLEIHENGEAQHDEIAKSINLIEESKAIISRENLLEFDENGEASVAAISDKKEEEARHKIVNPINMFEESKNEEEEEEELNKSIRKNLLEARENGEASVSINVTKEESKEDELNRSGKKKVTFDLNVPVYQVSATSNLRKQKEEEEEEEGDTNELSNSSMSSYISYPQNHRYHCCRNSNDEYEDIDLEDDANNDNNGNEMIHEESSYESLFSLSIDSTRKGNNPMPEMCDKEEVNSPLKQSVKLSVLKDTGITTPPSLLKNTNQQEKENIDTNLLDFSIITYNRAKKEPSLKCQENEIAVDTSLSSWLVESSQDDTPNSKRSLDSVENSPSERRVRRVDRPILGALKVEELKDEKTIVIGTVGSYLRHTGQATGISSY